MLLENYYYNVSCSWNLFYLEDFFDEWRVGRCLELWFLNGFLVDRLVLVMIIISDELFCEN